MYLVSLVYFKMPIATVRLYGFHIKLPNTHVLSSSSNTKILFNQRVRDINYTHWFV